MKRIVLLALMVGFAALGQPYPMLRTDTNGVLYAPTNFFAANVADILAALGIDAAATRSAIGLVIGTNVQAYDEDLADLADGSLSGSKIGTGIDGGNVTTGTVAASRIDPAIARLDSPAFINNPTVPTQSIGVSNTTVASTAFAQQLAELRQLASTILTQLAALTNGTAGQVPTWTGANTLALSNPPAGGGSAADVQVFTPGTNTWTKPSGKTAAYIVAIGGGGGGGSGRREAAGTIRSGGAGGGAGSVSFATIAISLLGSNETVIVGAGGTGAAGRTVDSASGNGGGAGGNSTFGSRLFAGGGGGGGGGGGAGSVAGTGSVGLFAGPLGAGGSGTGGAGGPGNSSTTSMAPSSGGAGGGVTSGDVVSGGGAGGQGPTMWRGTSQMAGGAAGSAGGNGGNGTSASADLYIGGAGGGGGGSSITGPGGNGGNGGLYGSGGGGGGGSLNGNVSGAGGNGANGVVLVISY